MKPVNYLRFCILCLCIISSPHSQGSPDKERTTGIIPAPERVEWQEGKFTLDSGQNALIVYTDEKDKKTADMFRGFLRNQYGIDLPVSNKEKKNRKIISFRSTPHNVHPESYRIKVTSSRIEITGSGAGLFYGLQSLTQLIAFSNEEIVDISCVTIEDKPRFAYRGIMQDVGYHIYPVEFIKKQIDWLAKYKLNVYHWHLTEDHGWRVEIKKYPDLMKIGAWREETVLSNYHPEFTGLDGTPYGGYYTQEQIREIVEYAEQRFVTVIPEIELPGHSLAALASYPELACGDNPGPFKTAQYWGIHDDVYCAGKEEVFRFLEDVLTEVMELFPSPYIHIGGDECPKIRWKECTYCRKRIQENGLKDEYELQSYFIKRIEKFVNSKGRRIIGWDEISEGGFAPDATVMAWQSVEDGILAAREGRDVIMAPLDYLYFDYVQAKRSEEPLAINWGQSKTNPDWGIVSLDVVYNFEPVPDILTAEEQKHIIGVEAPIWTEHIDTPQKVEYMLFPRLMALSEIAWSRPECKDWMDFKEKRLPDHLKWADKAGLVYRVPKVMGLGDTTYEGAEFEIDLKSSVKDAGIYYTFEGQEPRESDNIYDKPLKIIVPKGEKRQLKAIVIAPSGQRSAVTTAHFDNTGDIYRVGTGRVSLEPDHSVFSLTLGGYAAPGEGRFSLTWVDCGPVPEEKKNLFAETVTHGGREYRISENQLLYKRNDANSPWSKIGYKNGFTYTIDVEKIAIIENRLYALTPEGRHYLAAHKSNQDLYATATAISDGKQTAVLIGVDLTGFDYSLGVKIKNEIQRRNHIPAEAVIINASHTHFTPIVQAWTTWAEFAQKPDSIYLNDIVIKNVLEAVDLALADMKEVKIRFTRTESHIGYNRSLGGPDGLYDPGVDILQFITLDKRTRSLFFSASCHPVFRNEAEEAFTISANFPGVAKKKLEEQPGITLANFFQGCAGDINPLDGNHVNTGNKLAGDVLKAIRGKSQYVSGEITCKFDSLPVPVHAWDKKKIQAFKAANAAFPGDLEAEKNVRWADMMLSYYKNGNMPEYMPVYIQIINIGNWKLVGLSREAVTQYALEIKKIWPDQWVTVVGFSNDISSYLPNRAHVRAQNYEGFNSSLWYGQPAFFPENILDLVLDKVKELE